MTNSRVPASDIAGLLHAVHSALVTLGQPADAEAPAMLTPAVPIRKSVTPAYIVCLEDGRRLKMLKRHLRSTYGMTPEDYRTKWHRRPGDDLVVTIEVNSGYVSPDIISDLYQTVLGILEPQSVVDPSAPPPPSAANRED